MPKPFIVRPVYPRAAKAPTVAPSSVFWLFVGLLIVSALLPALAPRAQSGFTKARSLRGDTVLLSGLY